MIRTQEDTPRLISAGRFTEALRTLEAATGPKPADPEMGVLRAELLERTGAYLQSRLIAERLLASRGLSVSHQARCEFVLGIVDWGSGNTEEATVHFQRAVARSQAAGDLQRLCWAQLRLMVVLADRTGASGAAPILDAVRSNTTRLGDPTVTAALHIFIGELEAKRGFIHSAKRHTSLGQRLLVYRDHH